MYKIPYLKAICTQGARLEVLSNAENLPYEAVQRAEHALILIDHLLAEIQCPQYSHAYMERQLDELERRVDFIADSIPVFIKYRGITAEICKCPKGYACTVTDRHDNKVRWFINAISMERAKIKAKRHFDGAIACLRGFSTTSEFHNRIYGYSI